MTSKTIHPAPVAGSSSHEPAPWRVVDAGYADDVGGAAIGFMSALRRFRSRHGLQPTSQAPLLNDSDLDNLRAPDDVRPDPFADLPDDNA